MGTVISDRAAEREAILARVRELIKAAEIHGDALAKLRSLDPWLVARKRFDRFKRGEQGGDQG